MEHHEARLYYTTMAQDEARHVEAWLNSSARSAAWVRRDPHLDELARMFLDDLDLLEEKVFLMQVFFERLIISRFCLIARSRGTVLGDLCNRLTIDDGIHHGAGMAYERVLLENATKRTKQKPSRRRIACSRLRRARSGAPRSAPGSARCTAATSSVLREDLDDGVRLANSPALTSATSSCRTSRLRPQ